SRCPHLRRWETAGEPLTLSYTTLFRSGALADELGEPARLVRHARRHDGGSRRLEIIVGLGDAPLDGAVDRVLGLRLAGMEGVEGDRKSTRLNFSHVKNTDDVFCL